MRPSLAGWLLRDVGITLGAGLVAYGLFALWSAMPNRATGSACGLAGFVTAYVVCYMVHEWGHLAGARLAGANMPLNQYNTPAIGHFDIRQHDRGQFLWLSWGGVAGYCSAAVVIAALYLLTSLPWLGGGLALGAAAFVLQSLAVDLPQIFRIHRGDDIAATHAAGAAAPVILRRTWQMWVPLFVAVALAHLVVD